MLTIEELKSLEVGDWVWLVNTKHNFEEYYRKIENAFSSDDEVRIRFEGTDDIQHVYFEDYGTKWIAYKNKEQAENYDEPIRKETAKEILGDLLAHCNLEIKDSYEHSVKGSKHYGGVNNAYHQMKRIIEHYMERYGIEAKE